MKRYARRKAIAKRARAKGQALMTALILLVIGATLVMGNVYFFQQGARLHVAHGKIVQERYLAEAGLQMALQKLNSDKEFSQTVQDLTSGAANPFDTTAAAKSIEWGGGTITVVIEPFE